MNEVHDYRGQQITLTTGKQDDGQWGCTYTVINFAKSALAGSSSSVSAATEADAKKGALLEARKKIDSGKQDTTG